MTAPSITRIAYAIGIVTDTEVHIDTTRTLDHPAAQATRPRHHEADRSETTAAPDALIQVPAEAQRHVRVHV